MRIQNVNSGSDRHGEKIGFKSAVPVIVQLRMNPDTVAPIVGEKMNDTFMRKTLYRLNNTLKRGINPVRDKIVDHFRERFGKWVSDFNGKVTAFTCVDGDFKDGKLKPYFYFLTGDAIADLERLRQDHKAAVVMSQGYETANLKIAKDNYYNKGKRLVKSAFEKFRPRNQKPHAMYVTYQPVRNKDGVIKDYELYNAVFKPVEDMSDLKL